MQMTLTFNHHLRIPSCSQILLESQFRRILPISRPQITHCLLTTIFVKLWNRRLFHLLFLRKLELGRRWKVCVVRFLRRKCRKCRKWHSYTRIVRLVSTPFWLHSPTRKPWRLRKQTPQVIVQWLHSGYIYSECTEDFFSGSIIFDSFDPPIRNTKFSKKKGLTNDRDFSHFKA